VGDHRLIAQLVGGDAHDARGGRVGKGDAALAVQAQDAVLRSLEDRVAQRLLIIEGPALAGSGLGRRSRQR
jgi:hypothetical protein